MSEMKTTPKIWELSDEEIIADLGRMGWFRDSKWATKEEREFALIHEALRRILKLLLDLKGK